MKHKNSLFQIHHKKFLSSSLALRCLNMREMVTVYISFLKVRHPIIILVTVGQCYNKYNYVPLTKSLQNGYYNLNFS